MVTATTCLRGGAPADGLISFGLFLVRGLRLRAARQLLLVADAPVAGSRELDTTRAYALENTLGRPRLRAYELVAPPGGL